MAMKRRSYSRALPATGVSLAALKAPSVHAQAAPFKLGLLTVKTGPLAQGGIQMEQGVVTYPEGKEQHDGRPQGGVLLRRHRRQPGRHQDQGAGAGRARQGRRHPRAARGVRAARDHRLHRAEQDAAAEPRRRRGHDAAPSQSVFHPRLGDLRPGDAPDGGLRRQGDEAQAHRHASPKTSPSATSRWAASSRPSRTPAARSSRRSGRRWSRRTTRPTSRRSPIATASARASPARTRCAS